MTRRPTLSSPRGLAAAALALLLALAGATGAAAAVDAAAAFDSLKGLAGEWQGTFHAGDGGEAHSGTMTVRYKVSSGGSVVMETLFPDSEHEMVNVYHRDGDHLVMTHYCMSGNQPRMALLPDASAAGRLVFDYVSGTNLDPAKDHHMHGVTVAISASGIESNWTNFDAGQPGGTMTFSLTRKP